MDATPFLTEQIIAYIGNKRRLLELIHCAMKTAPFSLEPGLKFADLFSGSGVVSRLGKSLGFELYSNDWEHYSRVLNDGFIGTDKTDLKTIFGGDKALEELLDHINNLEDPETDREYIARYYAPASHDWEKADFNKERLFYTRQNGLIIDRIRYFIEDEFPPGHRGRDLLLALLLYEAATHTNTSGVFKAYHKGFGGHGRDAMKRILAPITLNKPFLIDSRAPVHIYREDARELAGRLTGLDLAYLDPPYNQHQYGSNYHMLNTIALWDRIPAPLVLNDKGVLKEKAAIRKDWPKTRSPYCYRDSAINSFSELIENLDARFILVSYSTDGIIPFDVMKDICMKRGCISLVSNSYTKYRGGKQSNGRLNTNVEFVLAVKTGGRTTGQALRKIDSLVARRRVMLILKQKYSRKKLEVLGADLEVVLTDGGLYLGKWGLTLPTKSFFELKPVREIENLSLEQLNTLYDYLSLCVCPDRISELEEIFSRLGEEEPGNLYFAGHIPRTLKKLAHKKNRESFEFWLEKIKGLIEDRSDIYQSLAGKIEEIELIAEKRFNN